MLCRRGSAQVFTDKMSNALVTETISDLRNNITVVLQTFDQHVTAVD